ncbi:hypothetical protein L1267_12350 [Pseudoalteromonas sp. OFAV1]|jgi:hypothetical protein|uniref:hypothetical protein n=1 Tax=Pseudoalteromonas sp. OFAV1 TaxID=2908892 RepID=UPI001F31A96B|nr:hypothetical protein [Pseudoalteromonas sp. OFAV1]MCF2901183.1 hypothetical protein [Pseudoalteromonas sp. OFAV1]
MLSNTHSISKFSSSISVVNTTSTEFSEIGECILSPIAELPISYGFFKMSVILDYTLGDNLDTFFDLLLDIKDQADTNDGTILFFINDSDLESVKNTFVFAGFTLDPSFEVTGKSCFTYND